MPSITQLEYVLAVHRHGHFGRAAEACHVSQPTLSAQIQKAEDELGITIFVRQNKPITATEKGYALIEQAQVVVAAHERLVRLARGQFQEVAGELALGVIPTLAPYVLPWFLPAFAERFPLVELTLFERPTDQMLEELGRRRLDVGIAAVPLFDEHMRERSLFFDPFYVYAGEQEGLLELDEVTAEDLDPARLWLLEDGHCVRHQTLAVCAREDGPSPLASVRFEAGSFETLRHLIDGAGGYTLIPETFARQLPKDRRRDRVRPFSSPTPVREVALVHPKSTWKADVVDALEATIRASIPRPLRQPPDAQDVLPGRVLPKPKRKSKLSARSRTRRT